MADRDAAVVRTFEPGDHAANRDIAERTFEPGELPGGTRQDVRRCVGSYDGRFASGLLVSGILVICLTMASHFSAVRQRVTSA